MKVWLSRYFMNGLEIERLRDEIAHWRSLAEYGCHEMAWIGGRQGTSGSPMADAVEHIILLEAELAKQLERRVRRRRKMEKVICNVADEGLQQVLRLRYIDALGWEAIADQLCYSRRQVTRLHNQALLLLELAYAGSAHTEMNPA